MIWIVNRKKLAAALGCIALVAAAAALCPLLAGPGAVTAGAAKRELPIYRVDVGEEKVVALSFDAAWGDEKTQGILDILAQHQAKATFFLVGFWVDAYPQQVQAIDAAGMEIGNHSTTHPHMSELTQEQVLQEVALTNEKITALTGQVPVVFRPPYGDYDNGVIQTVRALGMEPVQWDVDSLDWKNQGAQAIIRQVTENVRPGSIILFHNNSDAILEALPAVLTALEQQGYRFTTVSGLLADGPYTISHDGTQVPLEQAPSPAA